jgi:hypothetical protein
MRGGSEADDKFLCCNCDWSVSDMAVVAADDEMLCNGRTDLGDRDLSHPLRRNVPSSSSTVVFRLPLDESDDRNMWANNLPPRTLPSLVGDNGGGGGGGGKGKLVPPCNGNSGKLLVDRTRWRKKDPYCRSHNFFGGVPGDDG